MTNDVREARLDWAKSWLSTPKSSYAGGEFLATNGRKLTVSENPARLEETGAFHEAASGDVDQAVEAARAAMRPDSAWRKMTRRERAQALQRFGQLIREHQAELATIEALDNGKLFSEALIDDLPETADVFDYYAGWIDKLYSEVAPVEAGFLNYTVREPVGVCALVVPWNFPLLLAAWKIAPALAMGNAVVVKPSPFTSLSMVRLAEIVHEACILPPGVFNVLLGGAAVGTALSNHPRVDKISFTGSTAIGKEVLKGAASNLKGVTLELGGKSPNIIFEDAPDVEFAIQRSFTAMFSHKGEKCSEPTRFIVHRSLYDRFISELAKLAAAVRCGDSFDPSATQGAQCNKAQYEKILGYIEAGKKSGARLVAGGGPDEKAGKGYFVRPTIFADVAPEASIFQEEIFGPVLSITPFTTEKEAVELANATDYGLAAGFWTRDVSRAHRLAGALDAGMVFVNRYGCYDFASPFGGFKQSGWGKEMAVHSLDAYTKLKSIWVKL